MSLSEINVIAAKCALPIRKWADLKPGTTYRITDLSRIDTKFGIKVVAEIDEEAQLYFPNRLQKAFAAKDALYMALKGNMETKKLFIAFTSQTNFQFTMA